jgi:ankyrin repeat protein
VKHNDIVDENGLAPLEIALIRKDAPMINLLESHGAKINPNTTLKLAQNARRSVGPREVSD